MKKADNIINSSAKSKKKTKEKANRMFETKTKGTRQKAMKREAKAHEQSKRVEQLEAVEAPQSENIIRFNKPKSLQLHNKFPIMANRLTLAAGDKLLLDGADFQFPLGRTIAITGENGSGKTTLLHHIL